ncbi:TetR/AcrR family transcriptional regulator [Kitasatospora viridis]|uniref:TetR family transcriptional regulator n=1 Tax=Kitasatospora viridis TaxID=281105 RepID=A0A561UN61_9ACTN|nr:TetR/AcrR family transcriptional regulator [Kitasatospora viridis]TWG00792.1 TetR family transcriptional regulator [Kitasatospora viridis]
MTTDQVDPATAAQAAGGLRERKKQATREALSWAALRLAVQRGVEDVRVEEIATAAGVSPRTFNNYFSSKYEAIIFRHLDRTRQAAAALRARPAEEPLWPALTAALLAPYEEWDGMPPEQGRAQPAGPTVRESPGIAWTAGVRRLLAEPALQGEFARAGVAARAELAAAVAARTGTDAERDLYPLLVAAAALTAQQVASDQWLRHDPPVPLGPLLRQALAQLSAGLPDPSR